MKQKLIITPEGFTGMLSGLVSSGVTFTATEMKDGLILVEFTGGY